MRSTMASAAARPASIWSWPGWPKTTPVIVVRLPSIQRMARKAKQPPAASSEPVLTPTNPLVLRREADRRRAEAREAERGLLPLAQHARAGLRLRQLDRAAAR